MTRKHQLPAILLALALLLGAAAMPAAAAKPEGRALSTTEKADALYELGLFRGTGLKEDGTTEYALERTATRSEGAIMLVRLLGKESKAEAQYAAGAIASPFADLDSWAAATVTWLYANSLTNGTGDTTYSGKNNMSAMEFATFILRALGYGDSGDNRDFSYTQALPFAVQKQVITEEQSAAFQADFRRGGMVEMCYNALYLKMNDSDLTLLEKLTNDGVFKSSYKNNASVAGTRAMTLTQKYTGGGTANPAYMEEQCLGNAVCDDLDGDGKKEIVFGVRSIFCANAEDGKLKWRIADSESGGLSESKRVPFQILDFDGDGQKEIFAMTFRGTKGTVNIINASGTVKKSWTINVGHHIWAGYPADLDGDGKYELVIGVGAENSGDPAVYVYNNDGSVRSGWPQKQGYGLYSNSITAVDLDGDNVKEILLTYDETRIVAFHADGTRAEAAAFGATWDMIDFFVDRDTKGYRREDLNTRESRNGMMGTKSGMAVDDLDGDGKEEIIGVTLINNIAATYDRMNGTDNNSFSGEAQYYAPYILNLDRTRYKNASKGFDWSNIPTDTGAILALGKEDPNNPGVKIDIGDPEYRPLTVDVDGDGIKEILYAANDGQVHCFSLDGTEHGAWPFALNSRTTSVISFAGRPAAADLNGDGKMEIIFATYTPMGQTAERGRLYVLDYTGKKLAEAALPPKFYKDVDDSYANGSCTTPVVADIDNDGKLEIVVATYNCGLVAYEIS